jgi:hypothetical protein
MKLIKPTLLLLIPAALLFGQNLKETLSTPPAYEKGTLTISKESDKLIGQFTLEVQKKDAKESLELVAVDPAGMPKHTVILYDNGLNGDQIAGDGIYTGTSIFISHDKIKYYIKTREGQFNRQVLFEYLLFTW